MFERASTLPSNDWVRIRRFYKRVMPKLLSTPRDEWAFDAYFWSNGMVQMTPIERWLWAELRMVNAVMYPQFPIGNVFVDFANPAAKVAIECDGAAYHIDVDKDRRRDARLNALGWTVYRIPGRECATDSDPEAGRLGKAAEFVRRIVLDHHITRGGALREVLHHELIRHEQGGAVYDDEH